ncbi:Protein of unknown function, partial [Gryllus bimaculatus]
MLPFGAGVLRARMARVQREHAAARQLEPVVAHQRLPFLHLQVAQDVAVHKSHSKSVFHLPQGYVGALFAMHAKGLRKRLRFQSFGVQPPPGVQQAGGRVLAKPHDGARGRRRVDLQARRPQPGARHLPLPEIERTHVRHQHDRAALHPQPAADRRLQVRPAAVRVRHVLPPARHLLVPRGPGALLHRQVQPQRPRQPLLPPHQLLAQQDGAGLLREKRSRRLRMQVDAEAAAPLLLAVGHGGLAAVAARGGHRGADGADAGEPEPGAGQRLRRGPGGEEAHAARPVRPAGAAGAQHGAVALHHVGQPGGAAAGRAHAARRGQPAPARRAGRRRPHAG